MTGRARRRAGVAVGVSLAASLAAGGCTVVGMPTGDPGGSAAPSPGSGGEPVEPADPVDPGVRLRPSGTARAPRPLPPAARRFREVRALWVVRYTLTSPEGVRALVERADRAGFNTLVVQVRGRGDAYYAGGVEPRAEGLDDAPADFDPLAAVLDEAHARGMAVHAWMNTHLVASAGRLPADPRHMVHARPDLLAVPRALAGELRDVDPRDPRYVEALRAWAWENRSRVEGLFSSPANPEVHGWVMRVWRDVLTRYPVDGLHLDYTRYPSSAFDYSRGALDAFAAWVRREPGLAVPPGTDPWSLPERLPGAWDRFRREQVDDLVRALRAEAARIRPDATLSAAVFPDPAAAARYRFQDWGRWMDEGWLDVVAPMAYTADGARFDALAEGAVARVGDPDRVWLGIGTWLNSVEGTLDQIAAARRVGARGLVLFSYDWMVGEGRASGGDWLGRISGSAFGR